MPRHEDGCLTPEGRADGRCWQAGGFDQGVLPRKTEPSQVSPCLPQPLFAARGRGPRGLSSCQQTLASVPPSTLESTPSPSATAISLSPSLVSRTGEQRCLPTPSLPDPNPSPLSRQVTPSETHSWPLHSANEWICNMWSTHAMEYYLAVKKDGVLTHAATWVNLKHFMLRGKS